MNYFEKSPKKLKEVDILKKLENSDTTSPQEYEAII